MNCQDHTWGTHRAPLSNMTHKAVSIILNQSYATLHQAETKLEINSEADRIL